MTKSELKAAIFNGFASAGLPGNLGLALARQESNFDPAARATDPRDLARGGSFGLLQMSYKTAQGLGYEGPAAGLMSVEENVRLAAKLCAVNAKRTKAHVGSRDWVCDVASLYNSGKPFATAPESTRLLYAPRVWRFFCEFSGIDPTKIA